MKLLNIFKDNNEINEKNIVGMLAFLVMALYAVIDITFACFSKHLIFNEYVFDAFMWLVLGMFGISVSEKIWGKKTPKIENTNEPNNPEDSQKV